MPRRLQIRIACKCRIATYCESSLGGRNTWTGWCGQDWRRSLPLRGLIAGSRSRRRLRKRAFIRSASASRAACCASLPASPDAVLLSSWSAAAADALGVSLVDRSPAA